MFFSPMMRRRLFSVQLQGYSHKIKLSLTLTNFFRFQVNENVVFLFKKETVKFNHA